MPPRMLYRSSTQGQMRADLDSIVLPSASALGIALKCIGSALGPQTRKEADAAMAKGTADHGDLSRWIDSGQPGTPDPRFLKASEAMALFMDSDECVYRTELELSIDPEIPEVVIGGMMSVDRSRFFIGATDLAILPTDDSQRCAIVDWKTGAVKADKPQWNWQLIHAALAVWVAGGMDPQFICDMAIAYIDGPNKDEPVVPFRADAAFLSSRLSQLAQLKARLLTWDIDNARLTEGSHCSFCRVKDRCPAKTKALTVLASALTGGVSDADMVQAFLIAREKYDRLEQAAMSIVEKQGEVRLPNGNVAKMVKWGKGKSLQQSEVKSGYKGKQAHVEKDNGTHRPAKEADETSVPNSTSGGVEAGQGEGHA